MRKQSRAIVLLSLLCLLMLGPLLTGCGAADKARQAVEAAKELATQAPGIAEEVATQVAESSSEEPTEEVAEEPTEEASSEPTEEAATELENSFDNLVSLAPVHMSSSFVYKENDEVTNSLSYEADVDANGNQHMVMTSNNGDPVEIILADGKMYMKAEGDQYIGLGDIEDDTGFSFLAIYGGAYLLAFNDMQEARLVGHEAIGPWQTDKYTIDMDLNSLGLTGLAAGVEGYEWEYSGTAWVEPNAKALVKAVVDWSAKNADNTTSESWHSEFQASEGTVTEITAPENVLSMGG